MATTHSTHQRASTKVWIIAVAVFVLLVAVAGYIQWRMARSPQTEPSAYQPPIVSPEITTIEDVRQYTAGRPLPPVAEQETAGAIGPNLNVPGEHIRGNLEARISIVEYANLTSNYGRLIQPELQKLIEANPDVNWIFRHYPQPNIALDYPLAYISECVYNQSGDPAFWTFVDTVYSDRLDTVEAAIALGEGLVDDDEKLQKCYDTLETEKAVKDNKRVGFFGGNVKVLPTFIFVDSVTGQERVVAGVDTPDFLQRVIDAMMAVEG